MIGSNLQYHKVLKIIKVPVLAFGICGCGSLKRVWFGRFTPRPAHQRFYDACFNDSHLKS